MNPAIWKMISEECEAIGVDPTQMIERTIVSREVSVARMNAIRRVRHELKMSIPKMAKLFNVANVTIWTALRNEPSLKYLRDEKIRQLWNTMSMTELAVAVGMSEKGIRSAAVRLQLPPRVYVAPQGGGHRPFTPRCGEILRKHGVLI